jgi:deoxycytidine triphosphate deaminase
VDAQLEQELALDRSIPEVFDVEDDVAFQRYQTFSAVDPFPDVPAALLSSADLLDYVAATGMVSPFRIDLQALGSNLKPATYGVPLLGKYVYWEQVRRDETDALEDIRYDKKIGQLGEGEELTLWPNTITYVELEPFFRLPRYIAARFNLAIRDIYRGILVGTGPLVDPGFEGRLSVPLHNLTSNEYRLIGGEVLVWMEFTKLSSPADGWRLANPSEQPDRRGVYSEFPSQKKELGLEDYLRKAHPGPIVSSIPAAFGRAQHAAEAARADAETARDQLDASRRAIRNIGIGGVIATLVAVGAILVPTWSLVNDANSRQDGTADEVRRLESTLQREGQLNARQSQEIAKLRAQLSQARRPRK